MRTPCDAAAWRSSRATSIIAASCDSLFARSAASAAVCCARSSASAAACVTMSAARCTSAAARSAMIFVSSSFSEATRAASAFVASASNAARTLFVSSPCVTTAVSTRSRQAASAACMRPSCSSNWSRTIDTESAARFSARTRSSLWK